MIDLAARFVIRTHDPSRGASVWWIGGSAWSTYIEDAVEFKSRNAAADTSETLPRPTGSPLPFVDLLEKQR